MIEQQFQFLNEDDKYRALSRLLEREMDGSRLLIFCETKRGCDAVTRQLRTEGWPALSIHGDKSQQERDWVLAVSAPSFCCMMTCSTWRCLQPRTHCQGVQTHDPCIFSSSRHVMFLDPVMSRLQTVRVAACLWHYTVKGC